MDQSCPKTLATTSSASPKVEDGFCKGAFTLAHLIGGRDVAMGPPPCVGVPGGRAPETEETKTESTTGEDLAGDEQNGDSEHKLCLSTVSTQLTKLENEFWDNPEHLRSTWIEILPRKFRRAPDGTSPRSPSQGGSRPPRRGRTPARRGRCNSPTAPAATSVNLGRGDPPRGGAHPEEGRPELPPEDDEC